MLPCRLVSLVRLHLTGFILELGGEETYFCRKFSLVIFPSVILWQWDENMCVITYVCTHVRVCQGCCQSMAQLSPMLLNSPHTPLPKCTPNQGSLLQGGLLGAVSAPEMYFFLGGPLLAWPGNLLAIKWPGHL